MKKQEFITKLREKLSGLPSQDVEERLNFYGEMIDDRMEEGCTEEEAVADIGSVEEIASQIIADIPLIKIAKGRIKPKRQLQTWEIILLALGSPIWLSLGIAAFAVVLSIYAVLAAIIITLWAIFVSFAAYAVGGTIAGIVFSFTDNPAIGASMIGAAFICAGLAIFLFFGCRKVTKEIIKLTKKIALGIKKCFVKKEDL